MGHRIIEINGQSVVATPHEKIVHLLSNAVGEVGEEPGVGGAGQADLSAPGVLKATPTGPAPWLGVSARVSPRETGASPLKS